MIVLSKLRGICCLHSATLAGGFSTVNNFSGTAARQTMQPEETRVPFRKDLKKRNINWYEEKINVLANKRSPRAFELAENQMVRIDKLEPSYFILHKLISLCANYGDTDKAFLLYNQMKQKRFRVRAKTFTCLFNACANSSDKSVGLEKARRLRSILLQQLEADRLNDLNIMTYKSMIKAFGRCGDIHTAFAIMDEVVENFEKPDRNCFAALLHACIEQKNGGFRLAMQVWSQMAEMKVRPNAQLVNLMLRAARDCSTTMPKQRPARDNGRPRMLAASENLPFIPNRNDSKLEVFGGVQGVLRNIRSLQEKPQLKTMSLLAQLCSSKADERFILDEAVAENIRLDTSFFNVLIVKMNRQRRFEEAKNVALQVMPAHGLVPDLHTFGSLATGCFDMKSSKALLAQLDQRKMVPSVELYNILLFNSKLNFALKGYLLRQMSKNGVQPNKITITLVEKSLARAKRVLIRKQKRGVKGKLALERKFEGFSKFYLAWLRKTPLSREGKANYLNKAEGAHSSDNKGDAAVEFVEDIRRQ